MEASDFPSHAYLLKWLYPHFLDIGAQRWHYLMISYAYLAYQRLNKSKIPQNYFKGFTTQNTLCNTDCLLIMEESR